MMGIMRRKRTSEEWETLHRSLAGVFSVSVETLINYPLDTLKTRLQLNEQKLGQVSSVSLTKQMIREEGMMSLYRGILPTFLMQFPRGALKFGMSHSFLRYLKSENWDDNNESSISMAPFLSGFLVGVLDGLLVFPLEFIKVRMQSDHSFNRSFRNSVSFVFGTHLAGLNGLALTALRNGGWHCVFLGLLGSDLSSLNVMSDDRDLSSATKGMIGGGLGSLFSSPFDVCKSRVQNGFSVANGFADIYHNDGIAGFYRGIGPKMIRLGFGGAIIGYAFEQSLTLLQSVHCLTVAQFEY